jgi:RIP homotypic interaction motif
VSLQSFQKDKIFIEKNDGARTGPYKTAVSQERATIFDAQLDVNEGDRLIRPLPNGKDEVYLIISAEFSPGIHSISAHFTLKLQKITAIQPAMPKHTTININNSSGIQVGDYNVINIQNALNELVQRIEGSSGSQQEKAEAKSKLAAFLTHPLVGSVLGGIAGTLVGEAGS